MNYAQPIFDLIDETETAPNGYAYAYGWNPITFDAYYGLVEVEDGIILNPIRYVTIPFRFEITKPHHADFSDDFLTRVINDLRQAI